MCNLGHCVHILGESVHLHIVCITNELYIEFCYLISLSNYISTLYKLGKN